MHFSFKTQIKSSLLTFLLRQFGECEPLVVWQVFGSAKWHFVVLLALTAVRQVRPIKQPFVAFQTFGFGKQRFVFC